MHPLVAVCQQVYVPCCLPVVAFSGLLLREAIEDLEWTGGEVQFVMRRNPTRFSLQSVKQQSLEVWSSGVGAR